MKTDTQKSRNTDFLLFSKNNNNKKQKTSDCWKRVSWVSRKMFVFKIMTSSPSCHHPHLITLYAFLFCFFVILKALWQKQIRNYEKLQDYILDQRLWNLDTFAKNQQAITSCLLTMGH